MLYLTNIKKKPRIQKPTIQKPTIQESSNINDIFRITDNPVIPLHIYQTWHDKTNIPPSVSQSINNIINTNPMFTHHLYDINECREFIKNNFPSIVLDTYDILIPYAFKADLWRYCILYTQGGIYLDVKYSCINNFNFSKLIDKEYFCKDLETSGSGIYNALIICKPYNEIILKCIYKMVEHASTNYYGTSSLETTGPLMMKTFFSINDINNFELTLENPNEKPYIAFKKYPILGFHPNYRNEQSHIDKHWSQYWNDRNIYNMNLEQYNNVKMYTSNNSMNHVFTKIYDTNVWGTNQNINYNGSSGPGSSIDLNKDTYIPLLKTFIKNNNIRTIIDLGCGDFICGPLIYDELDNITYYGYDTYQPIILYHQETYTTSTKYNFIYLDFYSKKKDIIHGDLCILKDVIMHWSIAEIYTFLDYVVENKLFKYILICNCCNQTQHNTDITTGQWRPLSCSYYPLLKYNPTKLYNYHNKEVSMITV
jgi:hypothetical protein